MLDHSIYSNNERLTLFIPWKCDVLFVMLTVVEILTHLVVRNGIKTSIIRPLLLLAN